jgi:hypothetical protein
MPLRTSKEIATDLGTYVLRKNGKVDISPGQVFKDVLIDGPADQMAQLYAELESIRTAQSVINAQRMSTTDMDNLASNFGLVRGPAIAAVGNVIFYSTTQPTSDVTIPAGTRVATQVDGANGQLIFVTSTAKSFFAASESNYYNVNTGYWELSVPVRAVNGGANANVGVASITSILNFNSPFNVTNRAVTNGGSDGESNLSLAARVINTFTGNNKGTRNGYQGTIASQPGVLDSLVEGPGDPLMTRDGGQGGKVDIWTLFDGSQASLLNSTNTPELLINWDLSAQSLNEYTLVFPKQPFDTDGECIVFATTGPNDPLNKVKLFEKNSPAPSGIPWVAEGQFHYTLNKQNDLINAQSVDAQDNIKWEADALEQLRIYSGTNTSNNLQLAVSYYYNQTINNLQGLIDDPNNHIITADVLVKQAVPVYIDIKMAISLDKSYSSTNSIKQQTLNNVLTALNQYINSNSLGQLIEKAYLVDVTLSVKGTSNVILDSIVITTRYDPIYDINPLVVENVQAGANEYFISGNIQLDVVTSTATIL